MLDFDEILLGVNNQGVKKYLREAIKSYQVGNYRSAIIAAWIAAMFDLVKKFEILVKDREQEAINVWKTLKSKIRNHENWEQDLINAAHKTKMIGKYDKEVLDNFRNLRNRYAHPSFDETSFSEMGDLFDPTPEEVRYFIRTLYDIILSQPAQLGAFYVNNLIGSIKDPSFFSENVFLKDLKRTKEIVRDRLSLINSGQIPRLIQELFHSLHSPFSTNHELNLLCFLVNAWGLQKEDESFSDVNIAEMWNTYIQEKGLSLTILVGILSYPECINELSEESQEQISSAFEFHIFKCEEAPRTAVNFLASADVVPLAKTLLDKAPGLIPLEEIIQQSWHYKKLFGDKFSSLFGQQILIQAQETLETCNGYRVNPVISALQDCVFWEVVNTIPDSQKSVFADKLIRSLNSNNYGTITLISFENRGEIPIKWVSILLKEWSQLINDPKLRKKLPYYLDNYLGLVQRYVNELGDDAVLSQVVELIAEVISENESALTKLEQDNKDAWNFWQETYAKYSN